EVALLSDPPGSARQRRRGGPRPTIHPAERRVSRTTLLLCLGLVAAFGGLATGALARHAAAGRDSRGGGVFHSGSCAFRRPSGQQFDVTIRCGTVTVPQDWGGGRP